MMCTLLPMVCAVHRFRARQQELAVEGAKQRAQAQLAASTTSASASAAEEERIRRVSDAAVAIAQRGARGGDAGPSGAGLDDVVVLNPTDGPGEKSGKLRRLRQVSGAQKAAAAWLKRQVSGSRLTQCTHSRSIHAFCSPWRVLHCVWYRSRAIGSGARSAGDASPTPVRSNARCWPVYIRRGVAQLRALFSPITALVLVPGDV
jgi:hypothetical protein